MGTRDRLADLRAQAIFGPDEEDHTCVIMVAGVQESIAAFEAEVERLKNCLNQIDDYITKISKLYSTDLNNYKACEDNKPLIEELMNDIRLNASKIRNKLKEFDDDLEHMKQKGQTGAEFRIKKNQHAYLLNTFGELMKRYNTVQIEYRDKCKRKIKTELEITGRRVTDEELENMLENDEIVEVFTDNYQNENQKTKEAIDDLKSQRKELEKLESSIRQVHQYFIEMSTLVEHQGGLVDRIETQVSSAREYAEEGVQQTKEALEHHRSFIKKKFCCYSVIVTIVVVFVIYAASELFYSKSDSRK